MAKVLIVDDSASMRQILVAFLEAEDHEVIVGKDGIDAVWHYKNSEPDAVLLDVNMPIMNGLDALKWIRRINPAARVAILTGERDETTVVAALAAGAADYVGKPYTSERIIRSLDALLAAA